MRRMRFCLLNSGILAIYLTVMEIFWRYMVTLERIFEKQNYAHQLIVCFPPPLPTPGTHAEPLNINISFPLMFLKG